MIKKKSCKRTVKRTTKKGNWSLFGLGKKKKKSDAAKKRYETGLKSVTDWAKERKYSKSYTNKLVKSYRKGFNTGKKRSSPDYI